MEFPQLGGWEGVADAVAYCPLERLREMGERGERLGPQTAGLTASGGKRLPRAGEGGQRKLPSFMGDGIEKAGADLLHGATGFAPYGGLYGYAGRLSGAEAVGTPDRR
ncbi:StaL [Streptomyces hygroscopicus subsp. limoneus]|nr:StaL [Streptomyces hygroscopicus subsp. limoneus]